MFKNLAFFASDKLLRNAVVVFAALLTVNIVAKAVLGLYTLCISDLCFLLCGDHQSRPGGVKAELWLGVLLSAASLLSIVFQWFVVYPPVAGLVESITWHVLLAAFLTMVGSYEAHMEQWKEAREITA